MIFHRKFEMIPNFCANDETYVPRQMHSTFRTLTFIISAVFALICVMFVGLLEVQNVYRMEEIGFSTA